jgi:hypothetical protein
MSGKLEALRDRVDRYKTSDMYKRALGLVQTGESAKDDILIPALQIAARVNSHHVLKEIIEEWPRDWWDEWDLDRVVDELQKGLDPH